MKTRSLIVAGIIVSAIAAVAGTPRQENDRREELAKLTKSRVEIARKMYRYAEDSWQTPRLAGAPQHATESFEELVRWSRRWADAELDGTDVKGERATAIEAHIARLEGWRKIAEGLAQGAGSNVDTRDVAFLDSHILEAKVLLLKNQ